MTIRSKLAVMTPHSWRAALTTYEARMVKRGNANIRRSLQNSRMITSTSAWGRAKRTTILSLVGAIMSLRRTRR